MPARSLEEIFADLRRLALELEHVAARSAPDVSITGHELGRASAASRSIDLELRILAVRRAYPRHDVELVRLLEVHRR